ncbi:carboxylating nicotinate-nucleotide diphosphorylase [bacterium]|nr:carboxylating nicotinate-nucleotide diphosphorylase [bacterium]
MEQVSQEYLRRIVQIGLEEDIGTGDITTCCSVPEGCIVSGAIVAKEPLVVAGMPVVAEVFRQVDPQLQAMIIAQEGTFRKSGEVLARVEGRARSILTAERLALNFLQRLSGIATVTARYVKAVEGTSAVICDTRKTTPGLRMLEKYAVRMGGGTNHRFGLYDQFLFKDNHFIAASCMEPDALHCTMMRARREYPGVLIEIEVDTLEQLKMVFHEHPDIILLDNFSLTDLKKAVDYVGKKVTLEASGGITLDTVGAIARTGVDRISVGALTHSVKSADISLDFEICP